MSDTYSVHSAPILANIIKSTNPSEYTTKDFSGRDIITVDFITCEFTPQAVSEIVTAPNSNIAPIARIYIPERRWKKHGNTLPPYGKARLPWKTSLYTTQILRQILPPIPNCQTARPSIIFGTSYQDLNIHKFHYHHTPYKSTDALVKIPWHRHTGNPDAAHTSTIPLPGQPETTNTAKHPAAIPATTITEFLSPNIPTKCHASLWCRVSSSDSPYGADYWIIHLVDQLRYWPNFFSKIK